MNDNDKHEVLLAIADIKTQVMVNRTIMNDVLEHQKVQTPIVNKSVHRINSLEQSRKTALALISALWGVIGTGLLTWYMK